MAKRGARDRNELKLTTPEFRGSFVTLTTPRSFGEQDPKYGINIVVEKDDPFWKKLDKKIRLAAEKKWDTVPKKLVTTIKDGDEEPYEEWEGCYVVPANSLDRPGVVDRDLEPITDRAELYSGAWYRAVIRTYAWHYPKMNKKGVSLQLDNVMKVRDDDAFSGRSSAMDDFADYVDAEPDEEEEEETETSGRRGRRGGRGSRGSSALD